MKKLILGLMMAFVVTAEAEIVKNYTINESLTATLDNQGVLTIIGSGAMPNYEKAGDAPWVDERNRIVSVVAEGEITIGDNAFHSYPSLTSVSLPKATSIGCEAFRSSTFLASVSLPLATKIGMYAFCSCNRLTSVSLPLATEIGANAFAICKLLPSVSLPLATEIGKSAFYDCTALKEVIVKDREVKSTLSGDRSNYGIGSGVRIYYELTKEQTEAVAYGVKTVCPKLDGDEIYEDVYQKACETYGVAKKTAPEDPQLVQEDEVAVKKESIAAPSAGTVTVEGNKVQLGVTVLKTSDLTAEKKDWGKVKLTKDDIDVDADGNIIVNVPVDSASGFMVIQTKDAKIAPAE